MEPTLLGIIIVGTVQVIAVAFGAGITVQKVSDLSRRVTRMEKAFNGRCERDKADVAECSKR